MNWLWWVHWKIELVWEALKRDHDQGGHHFVNGVCHCGQKTTDDLVECGRWK